MSFVRERKTSRQIVLRFGNFPTKLNRPLGSASHHSHVIVRRRNAISFNNVIKRQQDGRSKTHACYHGSLSKDLLCTFAVVLGSTTYHLSPDRWATTLQFRSMVDLPSRNWSVLLAQSEIPCPSQFLHAKRTDTNFGTLYEYLLGNNSKATAPCSCVQFYFHTPPKKKTT